MKQLFVALCLLAAGGDLWAQSDSYCTPFDTTGCVLDLDIAGDVFSGYRLKGVPRESYPDTVRCRIYHLDPFGVPVRQIVVAKEKWANCPGDIIVSVADTTSVVDTVYTSGSEVLIKRWPSTWLEAGEGGYRLMAVTPKEYRELRRLDKIWGEWFDYKHFDSDIEGGHPINVLECYPDRWQYNRSRMYCLEVMVYIDPESGQGYMTLARNPTEEADYTRCKTGGRYDTRMIGVNPESERRWIDKSRSVYPWLVHPVE